MNDVWLSEFPCLGSALCVMSCHFTLSHPHSPHTHSYFLWRNFSSRLGFPLISPSFSSHFHHFLIGTKPKKAKSIYLIFSAIFGDLLHLLVKALILFLDWSLWSVKCQSREIKWDEAINNVKKHRDDIL